MIYDAKMKQTHFRSSSNTSHLTKIKQIPYRTLLKRRNDTISASQLYQDRPSLKQNITKNNLNHSQISSQTPMQNNTVSIDIKDYVKKMADKVDKNRSTVMLETVNTAKIEDDRMSQKSTRSVVSQSQFVKKEIKPLIVKEEKGSLEQLEKRVQVLISETIGQIKRQKSTIGISNWLKTQTQEVSYEKELQYIMTWLKELSEKEEVTGQKFQDLNRKITMIEKLIARESIQGQIFQGMYFNWKTQRGNTTSFVNKSALKQTKKYNNHCSDQKKLYKQAIKSRQIVSKYDSTNSNSFKRPPKQFYNLSKEKKNSYSANRQPFPRSSYSAQYLNYGKFGTYSYKTSDTRDYPETSLAVKASTYQQEYKQKLGLTKSINFKDLDCYKNKFHNPNISFMNSSKKKANAKVQQKKIEAKEVKQNLDASYIKKSQQSLLGCMSMSCNSFFKSQHQKQYFWHNTMNLDETKNTQFSHLKSQIKDKRLEKLKDTFRTLAMRR